LQSLGQQMLNAPVGINGLNPSGHRGTLGVSRGLRGALNLTIFLCILC